MSVGQQKCIAHSKQQVWLNIEHAIDSTLFVIWKLQPSGEKIKRGMQ